MRNVTPKDPAAIAELLNAEDGFLKFVDGKFKELRRDTFNLIQEVGNGFWHMTVKELDRKEQLIAELRGDLESLRDAIRKKKKEEERGRGVLQLARSAPSTFNNYEAIAA